MRGIDFFLNLACECIYYIPSLEVHPNSGREEVQWLIIASKIEVKRLYQGRGCYSGFSEFYCHYHFLLVKSSDPFIDSIPFVKASSLSCFVYFARLRLSRSMTWASKKHCIHIHILRQCIFLHKCIYRIDWDGNVISPDEIPEV